MNLDKLFEGSQLKMAAQVEPIEMMSNEALKKVTNEKNAHADKHSAPEKVLERSENSGKAIVEPSGGEIPNNEAESDSQRSRRMVKIPLKLSSYDVTLSGHCPGCRAFVNERGVVCEHCRAYWHYKCANVTQEQIDTIEEEEEEETIFSCKNLQEGSQPDI